MRKFLQFAFVAAMFVMAQSAVAQDVTTVFSESFDAFTEGSEQEAATTDISSGVTNKLNSTLTGWSGRYVYEAGGMLKLGDGGNLQTARYDMKANKGIIKISMRVRSLDSFGAMYSIAVNYSTKVSDYVLDGEWHNVSYVVNGASTSSTTYIKLSATMAASGLLVDDLKVEQSEGCYPAPVAKQPRQADGVSFTAKWDYISGSTGYYFDVYTKDATGAPVYTIKNQFISGAYSSSCKVTGLDASETYFFVVRATNGTATSENSNEIQVVKVISEIDAPVAVEATEVNETGFTANWDAVTEAEGYEVMVEKIETLSEDKTVTVANEDFAAITAGTISAPSYPSLSEYLDKYTNEAGWFAYAHLYANGLVGLSAFSTNPATLTSPAKDLSSSEGAFTVKATLAATQYGSFIEGEVVTVNVYNGEELVETQTATLAKDFNEYTFNFTKGGAETYVEFSYPSTTNRVWIDDVTITQDKKAGEKLTNLVGTYDAKDATSYQFQLPLDEETTYNYSVRSYVTTVVSGDIDLLYSKWSNSIEVSLQSPTAINDLNVEKAQATKRIVNGQLVIENNGVKYNAAGQMIK